MRHSKRGDKFWHKKSLGQVFLRESWPCDKMVDSLKKHKINAVVEIGPGQGALTKVLLEAGLHVTVVEKDDRLIDRLNELSTSHGTSGTLEVVHQDILKFDIDSWIKNSRFERKAICGNIPYNISSPITVKLLHSLHELKLVILMVQLEFAERVSSSPNSKSYGSISVYTQLRSKAHLDFMVSRKCFHPIPKVDSAVLSLTPLKDRFPDEMLKKVEDLTRKAFSQRRKKLRNSIASFLSDEVELDKLPLDLNRRCDSLSPKEFLSLTQALTS